MNQQPKNQQFYGRGHLLAAVSAYLSEEEYQSRAEALRRAGVITGVEFALLLAHKAGMSPEEATRELDLWDVQAHEAKGEL